MEVARYRIEATQAVKKVISGHLRMGTGVGPDGRALSVNSHHLLQNGEPWLPVMGEMHFSRYPRRYWEESILKMKASGLDIVASYVFWIHHEEIEGEFDWTGDKDLRYFAQLCARHGMYLFPRIGPWCHGECRNGGYPDWLSKRCRPRTMDPRYFEYVRRLYAQIYAQLEGFLYKDGGPVIGVQLENEFEACGFADGGSGGEEHMMALKRLAREAGFDLPMYTATGWGSPIPPDELIPVQGAYPDAPWSEGHHRLPPSADFLFRDSPSVNLDVGAEEDDPGNRCRYDMDRYPWLLAELGPGNQIKTNRRPVVTAEDAATMSLVKLGSGVNLIGYYMFHGGSNPVGRLSTMEEPGYPVISYDFQAPIGEFGQLRRSYHLLKRLHLFIRDFGGLLAPMVPVLPRRRPRGPTDVETLRCAARVRNGAGFLFLSNYQRYVENRDVGPVQVELALGSETLVVPEEPFLLRKDVTAVWPFNLAMDGLLLKVATAQPLCKLSTESGPCYVFFTTPGVAPEYVFDGGTVGAVEVIGGDVRRDRGRVVVSCHAPGLNSLAVVTASGGQPIRILTLTAEQAERRWKAEVWGAERLFVSRADLRFDHDRLEVSCVGSGDLSFVVFPALLGELVVGAEVVPGRKHGLWTWYAVEVPRRGVPVRVEPVPAPGPDRGWRITLPRHSLDGLNDLFLRIDYVGDVACLYLRDRLIADHFYYGPAWHVGLKRFAPQALDEGLTLQITPLAHDAAVYIEEEFRPEFAGDSIVELRGVWAIPEYAVLCLRG